MTNLKMHYYYSALIANILALPVPFSEFSMRRLIKSQSYAAVRAQIDAKSDIDGHEKINFQFGQTHLPYFASNAKANSNLHQHSGCHPNFVRILAHS